MSRKRSFSKALGSRTNGTLSVSSGYVQNGNHRQSRGQRLVANNQNARNETSSEQTVWSAIPLPAPLPPIFNIQLQSSLVVFFGPHPSPPDTDTLQSAPAVFGPHPSPPSPDTDTLERIPGKIQTAQNGKQTANQTASSQNKSYATAVKTADKENSVPISEDEDPRLLLSQIYDEDSEAGTESQNIDIFEQSLFVRELILSLPIENETTPALSDVSPLSQTTPATARAIPVDCGIISSSGSTGKATAIDNDKPHSSYSDSKVKDFKEEETIETENKAEVAEGLENNMAANVVFSKESTSSEHVARGTDMSLEIRKSNGEERSLHPQSLENMADMKKDSSNVRQAQYSSGASSVAGIVRSQSSHPVSPFTVLVSGASEQ